MKIGKFAKTVVAGTYAAAVVAVSAVTDDVYTPNRDHQHPCWPC
ncbi:hypothetical protein [Nonomuraea soli]|uniref:Uncharacterized protein n=1 Tax=Nonomuraea soli TaxID=1032476 RepID=A0A7W0HV53_9ACTN|nr:hypothetical protein [Nonomuraea soli]MBA2896426.1 hypothetical protein [Nonomuraea soli]